MLNAFCEEKKRKEKIRKKITEVLVLSLEG